MVRTLNLPPTGQDGRDGPDFLHGVDLDRVHDRPARPAPRWRILAALVLAAMVIAIVALFAVSTTDAPEGAYDSGIAQAVRAQQAEFERTHDSGIDLWLRER